MLVPALHSLRQLVVHPVGFFEERGVAETLPIAIGLVVAFAIALAIGVALVGSMLAGAIDATVTVDNPDRPPEWVCEQHADDPDSMFGDGCDEPETVERDVGPMVYDAATGQIPTLFVAPFVLWLLGTAVIYAAGRITGGSPTFGGSLSLAGWAALPEFLRLAVGLAALRYVLSDLTITDPEQSIDVLESALAPIEPAITAATVLTVAWQWYLLTGGLSVEAEIPKRVAAVAIGVPLLAWTLITLA